MKRDQALQILADHKADLAAMGVKSISLFGSVGRDEARPDSDVDVLIEPDHSRPFTLFTLAHIHNFLVEIFGRPVDVGEADTIRPELRDSILRDVIRVA